ncbi:MAG: hypothetical protein CM15mP98_03010 [Paracoccaceae bacterium]|nr:MAG: hypothetical protein CM15mP98_03010 [Paracoccaceae bacterium]
MSTYNTITSLSESRIDENILYAGTDDGIIQYTKDGGQNWTKMTVDKFPETPSSAFVNDIKADLHNAETAYVVLDNHKFGDYKPYVFKTTNGGKKWKSITNGMPDGTLLWRIVQDHVNPNFLFLATEYGVYISLNQGEDWHKFSNGLPTISVRDLAIQKRENDLVLATFGRSFYVLDDYSALRKINAETLSKEGFIFEPRRALQYNQVSGGTTSDGMSSYYAKNPRYGANIKYYIKESEASLRSKRIARESFRGANLDVVEALVMAGYDNPRGLISEDIDDVAENSGLSKNEIKEVLSIVKSNLKTGVNIAFPGWEQLDAEINEDYAKAIIIIKDSNGNKVEEISRPLRRGVNEVNWDLTKDIVTTINSGSSYSSGLSRWVEPGNYTLELYKSVKGDLTQISEPSSLIVERIKIGHTNKP